MIPTVTPTPAEALARLKAGNRRFAAGRMEHPNQTSERRAALIHEQNPWAVVLGCADSRVAPEFIFDQGLGDLYAVRVAGNVLDSYVLASLEYAAVRLKTPLIVVLGHSGCGAIRAAANSLRAEGHLPEVVAAVRPAINFQRGQLGDLLGNAAKSHALGIVEKLARTDAIFTELIKAGKLRIVAAFYDQESGMVEFIERPEQLERPLVLD